MALIVKFDLYSGLALKMIDWKNAHALLKRNMAALPPSARLNNGGTDAIIMFAAAVPFVVGQVIQHFPGTFPQFLRWHLTNVADVPVYAAGANIIMTRCAGRSRPMLSSAFFLALGIGYKFIQARCTGRGFDYVDVGCFIGGMGLYLGARPLVLRGVEKYNPTPKS